MMSLLRTALWASVALALLPSFVPRQDSTLPADAAASDAVNAASATFADMSRLCERRPDACAAGSDFAWAFGRRVREGAKILYEFAERSVGKPERPEGQEHRQAALPPAGDAVQGVPGVSGVPGVPAAANPEKPSQDTLTAADMARPWHGPPARRDAGAGTGTGAKHAT